MQHNKNSDANVGIRCEAHYEKDTGEISIHVQDVKQDFALFAHISEDALVEKVRQIFFYSLHDHTVSQFRQMMTLRGQGNKTRGKNVTGKARELDIGKEKRFEKMWNKMQENP